MERLTVNDLNKVGYDPWELCGMDHHCNKGCHEEGGCTKGCHILKMYRKLAEYEDFEEIFRSKMTDAACDFLKDKEEFAKWLDRNKWIAKKCDEYARAEEQGKLIVLPCAVGDTVYVVLPTNSHITKAQINKIEIKPTLFGRICYFIEPVGNRGRLYRYFGSDFGKSVFLTEEQAEEALKKMEV